MKKITEWTVGELRKLPGREKWNEETECDSLVLLPTKRKHDSGYLIIDFILVKDNQPICRIGGCADVIHIEGVAGFGYRWLEKFGECPDKIPVTGWSIDCLPNGLLRLWPYSKKIVCGASLSSFEIWSIAR